VARCSTASYPSFPSGVPNQLFKLVNRLRWTWCERTVDFLQSPRSLEHQYSLPHSLFLPTLLDLAPQTFRSQKASQMESQCERESFPILRNLYIRQEPILELLRTQILLTSSRLAVGAPRKNRRNGFGALRSEDICSQYGSISHRDLGVSFINCCNGERTGSRVPLVPFWKNLY
jgi:hypothetical protein